MTDRSIEEIVDGMVAGIVRRHAAELERACWRMIANGQLFTQGWRLAVKVDRETLEQTTLPIPPGDPAPQGFDRLLSL